MNVKDGRGGGRDDPDADPARGADDGRSDPREDEPVDDVIEPGHPSIENAAFVLLGVLGTLYVLARIAGLV